MISPWVIYFCHFADDIKVVSFLISIVLWLFWLIEDRTMDFERSEREENSKRRLKIIAIICMFVAVVMPSKKTCIEMLVASMITPETLAMGKDTILDFVREIVQIVSAK